MSSFKSKSICALCCETFLKTPSNRGNHLIQFEKLCSSFYSTVTNTNAGSSSGVSVPNACTKTQTGRRRKRKSKNPDISEATIKLSTAICTLCLTCISSTLTKRDQLNSMEEEVRQLQMRILTLLKNVQKSIDTFQEEVGKMERTVQGSYRKVQSLDKFYCSENLDMDEDDRSGETLLLKDVIQFREKILTVFEDLSNFSNILGDRPIPVAATTADVENGDYSSEETGDDDSYPVKPEENVISSSPSSIDSRKVDEHEMSFPEEEALNNTNKIYDKKSHSLDLSPEHSDNEDGVNKDQSLPLTASNETRRPTDNCDSAQPLRHMLEFTKMTPFKHALLTKIFKNMNNLQDERARINKNTNHKKSTGKSSLFDSIDPRKTHFITYEPKTDSLNLGDIVITIDEQENSLACTKCDFKSHQTTTESTNVVEESMYNHIVGGHLKLFTCPYCTRTRNITTLRKFREHVRKHGDKQFICDICGKPLVSKQGLQSHKWFHLSEEEKAQAEKAGVKPPQSILVKRQNLEKRFQCSTCGKGFIYMAYLKAHEETHLSETELKHMCTECGRRFKSRDGLMHHLKYVCIPDKEKVTRHTLRRFHCSECPLKFPVQSKLDRHKSIYHPVGPPTLYKCSLCEKQFKTKEYANTHEKTHSSARPFLCNKGCGATYKTKRHCQRHEKLCSNNIN